MSYQTPSKQSSPTGEFIVPTKTKCWVVPSSCELIKLLFEEQRLKITDLNFDSYEQGHCFVRTLFLLALEDEYQTQSPSPLAEFARAIVDILSNPDPKN